MWTPRRIVFALLGLLTVAGAYFGYARFLGTFDGLPPLPEVYLPPADGHIARALVTTSPANSLDRKFELAFGQDCAELRFPMRLEMKQKGILMASYKFEIIKSGPREGWVEASPLSLASISERRGPDGIPEVNTVYCDVAYIKFDKLLRSMSDFEGRKIAVCELHADTEARLADPRKGRVRLLNNRRTLDLNDDIEMVTPGPVYYEAEPKSGQPNIYTLTEVQIFDHLNTDLPEPDHTAAKRPTMSGTGLTVFLTNEPKDKPAKKSDPVAAKKKEPKGVAGVDSVGLSHTVELNLWTDANASFVSPGQGSGVKKSVAEAKKAPAAKKTPELLDKRLLQVKTNGPFRYDVKEDVAHFEKPARQRPGLIEHVTVTRSGRATGQDLLDCEFLDVHFQRKKPPVVEGKDVPPKKDKEHEGELEIKMIRARGETVVITSDAENLRATGTELVHDADAKTTVLRGDQQNPMQAVKDGNLIRGSELHMYGDGKEITQAHILGAGSIGIGDIDPKTGEYQKQAFWTDRLVYQRQLAKDQPPLDVFTLLGKDGTRALFKDTSGGKLQQIEGQQLKVWLKAAEKDKDGKRPVAKKPPPKKKDGAKDGAKDNNAASVRPLRLEGTGDVRSTAPDLVIRRADYLNVVFNDVAKLMRPPKEKEPGKGPPLPAKETPAKEIPPKAPAESKPPPLDPKTKEPTKETPEEKIPFVVVARSIEAWINRDPEGQSEIDRVHAVGDVEAHQDPPKNEKGKFGNDVAGQTVHVQAHADGYKMTVTGDPADKTKKKWGVVRVDTLTLFGFDIIIDQRNDTAVVKGEGSMEVISKSNLEGKKLEQASVMYVFWQQRMDFLGADKLIYYHGGVQAYQDFSKLKCEWMQVLLDRPLYIDPDRRAKAKPKTAPKPGAKQEDDNPKIDTVMCFNAPKDEDAPRPKVLLPVTAIDEVWENGKLVKFQSIQAPEIVTVNTPLENKRTRRDIHATASDTTPGNVRIWQAGQKDIGPKPKEKPADAKKSPPPAKGELAPDQEMKLTIVQYGEKMKAEDLRKRAKFWTNVRVVHLAADSPTVPVDLREGDIPKGAVYMEARDTLEVFTTPQIERGPDGKEISVEYQEMIALGNVRVRKQGEFFGDADRVTYSELKDTLTFHGTEKNPAVVNQIRGQGIPNKTMSGRTITYYLKTKTMESTGATQIRN